MPTHHKGTPQEELALNTFIKLTRATESLEARLLEKGTQGKLTPTQFGVLEVLYHLGAMCQNEIGGKLLKSSGNMTLVLDNLEKHELVRRERNPEDRRMVMVSLTEMGRKLIEDVFPRHLAAIVEEMSVLSPEEQTTLGTLCKKLGKQASD